MTAKNGAITTAPVAGANDRLAMSERRAIEVVPDVWLLAGWGIAHSMAIRAPKGWIIVDTGDSIYANYAAPGPATQMFRGLVANAKRANFGVPLLSVPGNHDNTDATTNKDPKHPLFCHGVYMKPRTLRVGSASRSQPLTSSRSSAS